MMSLAIFAPDKHVTLALGIFNAAAGNIKILGFAFNADELAAHLNSSNASGAAAHEGIKDYIGIWQER